MYIIKLCARERNFKFQVTRSHHDVFDVHDEVNVTFVVVVVVFNFISHIMLFHLLPCRNGNVQNSLAIIFGLTERL